MALARGEDGLTKEKDKEERERFLRGGLTNENENEERERFLRRWDGAGAG